MKVTIERVSNGWVLRYHDYDQEGTFVFTEDADRSGFVDLLREVTELYHQHGSRFDEHRVVVGTEAGDKCAKYAEGSHERDF